MFWFGKQRKTGAETREKRRGFSLLEMIIAVALMALIFLGTMNLFISTGRMEQKVKSASQATTDANLAIQGVTERVREAYRVALPGESDITMVGDAPWPNALATSDYQTVVDGTTISTGILVTDPLVAAATNVQGQSGTIAMDSSRTLYDRTQKGTSVLFYRGDDNGAPNPSSGKYLWMRDNGGTGNLTELADNIANVPNAVSFRRMPNEADVVMVKVINGEWAMAKGWQTNETTDGSKSTNVTHRSIRLRNAARQNKAILASPNVVPTPTPTPVPTATPVPTPVPTATPRPTPSPTPRPTATPRPTPTPSPRPTATPIPTPSPRPTATPRPTPTPTPSPRPTASPRPTPSPTPRPTATPRPTPRPTPTPTPTPVFYDNR